MPMSGSNYVAPTWVDKGPPALDAAELQAMCNTIVQNQGDAAALQAAVSSLQSAVSSAESDISSLQGMVVTGSYVGTGTYGENNPNSLSFSANPVFLIVSAAGVTPPNGYYSNCFIWVPGTTSLKIGGAGYAASFSQSGNTVSWYSIYGDGYQLNYSGNTYNYIAILKP